MKKLILFVIPVLLLSSCWSISDSINEKFSALNEGLEQATEETRVRSEDLMTLVEARVLHDSTTALIDFMQNLKEQLIEQTGGWKEEGKMPNGAKDTKAVALVMLGDKGKVLEVKMDNFIDLINTISSIKRPYLTLEGWEDPLSKDDPDHRENSFLELNFEGTPLIACLAMLSNYQNRVATIEAEIMLELADKVDLPKDSVQTVKIEMH